MTARDVDGDDLADGAGRSQARRSRSRAPRSTIVDVAPDPQLREECDVLARVELLLAVVAGDELGVEVLRSGQLQFVRIPPFHHVILARVPRSRAQRVAQKSLLAPVLAPRACSCACVRARTYLGHTYSWTGPAEPPSCASPAVSTWEGGYPDPSARGARK